MEDDWSNLFRGVDGMDTINVAFCMSGFWLER